MDRNLSFNSNQNRQGTAEEKATVNLVENQGVEIRVLYTNSPPPPDPNEDITKRNSQPALMRGLVAMRFSCI